MVGSVSASVGDSARVTQPCGGFGEEVREALQHAGGVVAVHAEERAFREVERVPVSALAHRLQGGLTDILGGVGNEHGLHAGGEDREVVAAVAGG